MGPRQTDDQQKINDELIAQLHTPMREITSACIVMPTYNEADNIGAMIDALKARAHTPDTQLHLLVVDDNSPDGTAQIVREREEDWVHLLLRTEKEGLGAAYTHGMQHAMKTLTPDAILEMDADFSHNPKDVPRLIDSLKHGADIAIGSRYVPGGSTPSDWGAHRKLISNAANTASRTLLLIADVKDCTGGFRAIRTEVLKRVDLTTINTKGYVFQVALLDALIQHGARVHEIPIHFKDRQAGQSKMRLADMIGGGARLLRMAGPRWRYQLEEALART